MFQEENEIVLSDVIGEEPKSIKNDIDLKLIEDDPYDRGPWQKQQLIIPDWASIIKMCKQSLAVSRDLYVLNRLCECMCRIHGLEGMYKCMQILEKFFSIKAEYYPLSEKTRIIYFNWINTQLSINAFDSGKKYSPEELKTYKTSILEIASKCEFFTDRLEDSFRVFDHNITVS